LPHGRNKADRAFLNMHATSIHCGVCHMQTDQSPLPLVWYNLEDGRACDPPALLRAYGLVLEAPEGSSEAMNEFQANLVAMLRAAARQANDQPQLRSLADNLAAVRVGSDEWHSFFQAARLEIPRHFRGEYGAKLALAHEQTGAPRLDHPGNEQAVRDFLAGKDTLSQSEIDALLTAVHPLRRSPTLHCQDCHRPQEPLVDLVAAGYPPPRVQQLSQRLITRMIDHIIDGQPFQMPGFVGPGQRSDSQSQTPEQQP
jgi:hypothetical protein